MLCAVLAVGTAAPWFAPLLMPDIFAPVAVLCLFVLAYGGAGRPRAASDGARWPGRACWAPSPSRRTWRTWSLAAGVLGMAALARRALPWRPAAAARRGARGAAGDQPGRQRRARGLAVRLRVRAGAAGRRWAGTRLCGRGLPGGGLAHLCLEGPAAVRQRRVPVAPQWPHLGRWLRTYPLCAGGCQAGPRHRRRPARRRAPGCRPQHASAAWAGAGRRRPDRACTSMSPCCRGWYCTFPPREAAAFRAVVAGGGPARRPGSAHRAAAPCGAAGWRGGLPLDRQRHVPSWDGALRGDRCRAWR